MKKFVILGALLSIGLGAPELVNSSNVCLASETTASTTQSTRKVKAFKPLRGSAKAWTYLTVSWDGDECWVLATSSKELDRPVKAYYDQTYSGYPFCANIKGTLYYFSL